MTPQDPKIAPRGSRVIVQKTWGAMLALMGIALFVRIPEVTARIAENSGWSPGVLTMARVAMVLVGVILLGGGIRKLVAGEGRGKNVPPKDQEDNRIQPGTEKDT